MIDDVFCKILKKELPANILMETEDWIAINDIHPEAPVHVLIICKNHFDDLASAMDSEPELAGKMVLAAKELAKKLELEKGFRLIINQGENSGQLVPHFHIHLLGGKRLGPKLIQDK